jgi:hypothetical protein
VAAAVVLYKNGALSVIQIIQRLMK